MIVTVKPNSIEELVDRITKSKGKDSGAIKALRTRAGNSLIAPKDAQKAQTALETCPYT